MIKFINRLILILKNFFILIILYVNKQTFIYDKYVPVFKKMSKLNIRIPDYASALIKVEEYKINALIVWVKENIIILDEETDGIILEICKRIGWKAYKMSDIDYDYLKKNLIIQDTITI